MKRFLVKALGLLLIATALVVALGRAPDRDVASLVARWAPPPSDFIELKGMLVHLRDEGPRDDPLPLLLVHGTSASLHTWEGWVKALKAQRRVITFDLAGFGLTGPFAGTYPPDDYRGDALARFTLDLADHLKLDRFVIGGNSLGGEVAWRVASLAPQRVERLILVDASGPDFTPESVPIGFRLARLPVFNRISEHILPRPLVAASVANVYGDPGKVTAELVDRYFELTLRAGNRRALGLRMQQLVRGEGADRIATLKLPTLILWGGKDRLIPPSVAKVFEQQIDGSRLVVFDDLGHVPHEEDPVRTVEPVKAFLGLAPSAAERRRGEESDMNDTPSSIAAAGLPTPAAPASAGSSPPTAETSATPVAPARAGTALKVGVTAFVFCVAIAGYVFTGAPQAIGVAKSGPPPATAANEAGQPPITQEQIARMTERLAQRMKEQPDDPVGWAMLGRSYMVLERPADAKAAYEQALKLKPEDAALLADLADAVAMANGRTLAGEPTRLIERALQIDPDHIKSLALAGTAAFDRNDYVTAVKHWERIVALAPAGSPLAQQARQGADEARRLGKMPPAPAAAAALTPAPVAAAAPPGGTAAAPTQATPTAPVAGESAAPARPAAAPAAASVSGNVILADALKSKVGPDDTLFVFARAAEGGRMPLAILRLKASQLPARFTLDDSLAMAAGAGISSAQRVVVTARISKSGNAMPQSGDLEGSSAAVAVGASDLKIEVSRVVP